MEENLLTEEDYNAAQDAAATAAAEAGERITRQETDTEMIQKWIKMNINRHARTWLVNDDGTPFSEADFGPEVAKRIPMSDLTASDELYRCFSGTIHYSAESKTWRIWNGIFHERVDGDLLAYWITEAFIKAHRWALQQVKAWYRVAASVLTGKAAQQKMNEYSQGLFKEHREYRTRIHNNGGFTAMSNNMRGKFGVSDSHFINDQRWLVFWNGVVDLHHLLENPPQPGDLRAIELLPHDPKRSVWRCVEANFDPGAQAPRWQHYLNTSQPDPELRKFLAVTAGAAMIGQSKIKTIPVLTGPRDSGKTVFTNTMSELFGGYGGQPDTSAINKGGNGTNFEQDKLRGLRFVGISEPNTDRKIDDSFLKKFTGGDSISSRTLNAASSEWKSQGVMFFATNNDLKFNTADNAILSRLATVRFPYRFYRISEVPPGKEDYLIDYTLESDIQKEFSGIINWVLNGALVFLYEGVRIPEAVTEHRKEQVIDGSSTLAWLEHVKSGESPYTLDPVGVERANKSEYADLKSVHMAYSMWCAEEGEVIAAKKVFSKELREALEIDEFIRSGVVRVQRLSLEPLEKVKPVQLTDE